MNRELASTVLVALIVQGVACGGDPSVDSGEEESSGGRQAEGGSDDGGEPPSSGGTSTGGAPISFGGSVGTGGGPPPGGEAGAAPTDPCSLVECGEGQRCEVTGENGACVDNTCEELACTETEECQPAEGGGNVCVSIGCNEDVECPPTRYCETGVCADDVCEPGTRTCSGQEVSVCPSNGGPPSSPYSCGSPGYFESMCMAADPSRTGCGCEDDWDCPEFTTCETGLCVGTGVEPTCTLPPVPFEEVLPQLEFRWGGANAGDQTATGKAFPWSSQVLSTPMVANLDDDNGDGVINELDFPEIVFMSYAPGGGGSPNAFRGILRAVHAGGPNKGLDFFANCGLPTRPATPAPAYNDANGTYWSEGQTVPVDCIAGNTDSQGTAIGRAAGALAVGDLDYDGVPEIVMPLQEANDLSGIAIFSNRGELIASRTDIFPADGQTWDYAAPAIANLDFAGLAEIVVGNRVVVLNASDTGLLGIAAVVAGSATTGAQVFNFSPTPEMGPTVCLADVRADTPGLEIVAGPSLYSYDPANTTSLGLLWDSSTLTGVAEPEGFCAVADVLGADEMAAPGPDNPLDGVPEVILVSDGNLVVLRAQDGGVLRVIDLEGGNVGGAPNVDDFDGDGFPEIATALQDFYTVIDLQDTATDCPAWPDLLLNSGEAPPQTNPARDPGGMDVAGTCAADTDCNAGAVCNVAISRCVCLHNGWKRDTEDDSSRATSSSVFDFNGDRAAEVVYVDECYFRVYDGASGGIYLAIPSLTRTIIENPVVADVDNDGNAEIAFVSNNEGLNCSETNLDGWPDGMDNVARDSLPNGIEVWGDPSDTWVAARRIWNQHAYHVSNVTEAGGIPLHEPESWLPLNGRLYNSYRAQPRNYDVAPDLVLVAIQISSPGVACGELSDEIQITVQVQNQGDLRVGPGVVLEFSGSWLDPALDAPLEDMNGDPIQVVLDTSLEPGASTLITVTYEAGNTGREELPTEVQVTIDGPNAERECDETNNEISAPVDPGEAYADLRLVIDDASGCTPPVVELTVYNDGSTDASDVLVRIYAGDPSAGGTVLGEVTIDGPIAPGESESVSVELEPLDRNVTIWAVADPLDAIMECNDANNVAEGPRLECEEPPPPPE